MKQWGGVSEQRLAGGAGGARAPNCPPALRQRPSIRKDLIGVLLTLETGLEVLAQQHLWGGPVTPAQ